MKNRATIVSGQDSPNEWRFGTWIWHLNGYEKRLKMHSKVIMLGRWIITHLFYCLIPHKRNLSFWIIESKLSTRYRTFQLFYPMRNVNNGFSYSLCSEVVNWQTRICIFKIYHHVNTVPNKCFMVFVIAIHSVSNEAQYGGDQLRDIYVSVHSPCSQIPSVCPSRLLTVSHVTCVALRSTFFIRYLNWTSFSTGQFLLEVVVHILWKLFCYHLP